MAKVFVTINPKDGTRKYEVQGMVGGGCEDLTKALMQNNEVLDHQYTEEYCVPDTLPDYVEDVAESMQESTDE